MAISPRAYQYLNNQSLVRAAIEVYVSSPIGPFFWAIIYLFLLIVVAIKSESPAYIAFYSILGHILLINYIPAEFQKIFYFTVVLSLAFFFWSLYASKKTD